MKTRPVRFLSLFLAVVLCCAMLATPAFAADSRPCNAYTLIDAIADRLHLQSDLDTFVEQGIITETEKNFIIRHGSLTSAMAWRIALPVYGIYPYPAEFYPDIVPWANCTGVYADARAAAINSTLASSDTAPDYYMTVTDLDTLLHRLATCDFLQPAIPTITCPYVDPYATWSLDTYAGRNSLIKAWDLLPPDWRDDFIYEAWSFRFSLPVNYHYYDDDTFYATGGQTDYDARILYLCNSRTEVTLHEFTHFAYWRAGWSERTFRTAFNRESDNLRNYLSNYAQTSPTEYFCEFVAYWLLHPEAHAELNRLAPRSMALIRQLATEYPSLID